ncbi:unnamed protein product, partial [Effrenium voratum]
AAGPAAFNRDQQRFLGYVDNAVDRALALGDAATEAEADVLLAQAREGKAAVALGPPGSGKTTAIFASIERTLERGGRVLFALPTAQLASRMRQRFGDRVDIDTCHAAFGLHKAAEQGGSGILGLYALVVVDELSQLEKTNFDRILRQWMQADRAPALVFLGDRWQMAGVGEDPEHQKLLRQLRTASPDKAALKLLRRKLAWPPGPPTVEGLRKLLKSRPDTTIVTCTRRGAAEVNEAALKALFPRGRPQTVLAADVDSNPDNYGVLKPVELLPSQLPIYRGARVFLT